MDRLNEEQRDDEFFYTWGEHQQKRGANFVASVITHFLEEKLSVPDNKVKTVAFLMTPALVKTRISLFYWLSIC